MYSYRIKFLSLEDTIGFEIKSPNESFMDDFVYQLLSIFIPNVEKGSSTVNAFQTKTKEINQKLIGFFSTYAQSLPEINGVIAFFKKLKEDEPFFFIPKEDIPLELTLKMRTYLVSLKEDTDFEEAQKEMDELYGDLMNKYEVSSKGSKRVSIGERDKTKRVCRFCQNTRTPFTFDSKAHAISEALGNKTLILLDECDGCNKFFSENIEPDIIEYFAFLRTIFKVKGKAGQKKYEGRNFKFDNTDKLKLSFFSGEERPKDRIDGKYNVNLKAGNLVMQSVYKALCKYFLSVISQEHLKHFDKTVDWINGDIKSSTLPKIACMTSYHRFTRQPELTYYIRKDDDQSLPYAVAEFCFTCEILVFIIPFSDQDNRNFTEKTDWKHFWSTFRHYDLSKGWIHKDFSNDSSKKYEIDLNFQVRKKD